MCTKNSMTPEHAKKILSAADPSVKFSRANLGDTEFTLAYTDSSFGLSMMSVKESDYSRNVGRAHAYLRLKSRSQDAKLRADYALTRKGVRMVAEAFRHLHELPVTWPSWFTTDLYGFGARCDLAVAEVSGLLDG